MPLADIFISYAREDRAKIERLAAALEAEGYSVWWDRHVAAGAEFSKDIERELEVAKAVIVAWSVAANESRWVKDEAVTAADAGKILPVTLDGVSAPMGFRQYQTINLVAQRFQADAPDFADLIRAARRLATGETSPTPVSRRARSAGRAGLIAGGAAGAVLLLVLIGAFIIRGGALSSGAAPVPANVRPEAPVLSSIAVLPFADLSPGKDQDYFSDGVAEEILNVLAQSPDLKVAGRTSSFKFKNINEDLRVIGDQLGVAHILEGSVRKDGQRVRITAQLVKVDDGFHLWSETYERDLTDIFAVQEEISRAIADALSVKLGGRVAAPGGVGAVDPQALDLYLRARQLVARRTTSSITQAAILFEAAAILDSGFDSAFSGAARAHSLVTTYQGTGDFGESARRARAAAEKALALNPTNAEAHSASAYVDTVYFWDFEAALRQTELAVRYGPNDAEVANFAGDVYRYFADFPNADKWERRAIELDPLFAVNHADYGWFKMLVRECAEAFGFFERAHAMSPNMIGTLDGMARSQICIGENDAAYATARRLEKLDPDSPFFLDLDVRTAYFAKRSASFDAKYARLAARARTASDENYSLAQIDAFRGDLETVGPSLERAYQRRAAYLVADELWLLPEEWPDHPAIRAALDKPELNALYAIRRRNLSETPRTNPL